MQNKELKAVITPCNESTGIVKLPNDKIFPELFAIVETMYIHIMEIIVHSESCSVL